MLLLLTSAFLNLRERQFISNFIFTDEWATHSIEIENYRWSVEEKCLFVLCKVLSRHFWLLLSCEYKMPSPSDEESAVVHCRATFATTALRHSCGWCNVVSWRSSSIFSSFLKHDSQTSWFFITNDGISASRNYERIVRKMTLHSSYHSMKRAGQKRIDHEQRIIIHVK